jgi:hypothetical protein
MLPPRKPTWEQNQPLKLAFEHQARQVYPGLRITHVGRRKYARTVYGVNVPVAEYESRAIEMHFRRIGREPWVTRIYADGPTDSPHRYKPHTKDPLRRPSLCIWYPDDSPSLRWVPKDGLLSLIEMTRVHLFKEAYWRETGEWLGEEVPHSREPMLKAC